MRCPDPPVHPAARSALRGPLLALGAFVLLALAVYAASALASAVAAVTVAILAVDAAGVVVLVRLLRKPKAKARVIAVPQNESPAAITAPPLAIAAPRPVLEGVVVAESERVASWDGR